MRRVRYSKPWGRSVGSISSLVMILMTASLAVAQDGDTSNAATWYERAYGRLQQFTREEDNAIEIYRAQGGIPSDEVRELMRRGSSILDDLRRGNNQAYCDFDALIARGPENNAAYNNRFRQLVRWVDADVKARIAAGDSMGAAQQVASVFQFVQHAGDRRVSISASVSASMMMFADEMLKYAVDENALGPAESAAILQAMAPLDALDPFQAADALAGDQALLLDRLAHYQQSGVEPSADGLLEVTGYEREWVPGIDSLNPDQMLEEIHAYHDLLGRFAAIYQSADPQWAATEFERLKAAAENGSLGPFCSVAVENLSNMYVGITRYESVLDVRRTQLKGLIQGDAAIEMANAAAFYRRGIEHLDSVRAPWPEILERLREPDSSDAGELTDNAWLAARRKIDQAIDEFTGGSRIRRCDFSVRRLDEEFFIPEYGPGMQLALAIIFAEAMNLERTGRYDDALAQLATGFRVIGHLGTDGLVISALESQDAYRIAVHLVEDILAKAAADESGEAQTISSAHLAELAAAIRRTGPRDPFGYEAAMTRINAKTDAYLRGQIVAAFQKWRPDAISSAEHTAADQKATAWLQARAPAERWYAYGMIVLNAEWDAGLEARLRQRADRYAKTQIASILVMAIADASVLKRACRVGRFDDLTVPKIEQWLHLSEHMEKAHADERAGARLAQSLTEMARATESSTNQIAYGSGVAPPLRRSLP